MKQQLTKKAWWSVACVACVLSCSPSLDSISEVEGLRILGVQKDKPYAIEGEEVRLRMLYDIGSEHSSDSVQTFWGFWCVNPSGDVFSNCLAGDAAVPPSYTFDQDEFTIQIPEGIVRPSPTNPNQPPYAVAFVFYAICGGELSFGQAGVGGAGGAPILPESDGSLPPLTELPQCLDADGTPLGSDDFVVGYSSVYVFEGYRNQNPIVLGMKNGQTELSSDCIGDACSGRFDPDQITGCDPGVFCVDTCEDNGDQLNCPEISLSVDVDRASAEVDEIARDAYGNDLKEALWVSYFVDRGSLKYDLRLVNDASKGWIDDQSTEFYAPKEPGPIRIWAVVRDNRGGQSWVRVPAFAR